LKKYQSLRLIWVKLKEIKVHGPKWKGGGTIGSLIDFSRDNFELGIELIKLETNNHFVNVSEIKGSDWNLTRGEIKNKRGNFLNKGLDYKVSRPQWPKWKWSFP
jgi:hypothetical protein